MTEHDQLQPRLRWRTPEGFAFEVPLAAVSTRALAWLLDLAVIATGLRLLYRIVAPFLSKRPGLASAVIVVAVFAASLVYAAAMEWFWHGQTLGKRVFGLRVLDARGLPLSLPQVLTRNLLRILDVLPFAYLVGVLACLASRRGQRLGDLIADTVVARADPAPASDLEPWRAQKYNSLLEAPGLAARLRDRTPPQAAELALEALARREQLDPAPRARLYRDLAEYFCEQAKVPEEVASGLSGEQLLRDVVGVLFPHTGY